MEEGELDADERTLLDAKPQTNLPKKKSGSMSKKLTRQATLEQTKRLDASKPKPTGKLQPSVVKVKSKVKKVEHIQRKLEL